MFLGLGSGHLMNNGSAAHCARQIACFVMRRLLSTGAMSSSAPYSSFLPGKNPSSIRLTHQRRLNGVRFSFPTRFVVVGSSVRCLASFSPAERIKVHNPIVEMDGEPHPPSVCVFVAFFFFFALLVLFPLSNAYSSLLGTFYRYLLLFFQFRKKERLKPYLSDVHKNFLMSSQAMRWRGSSGGW